MNIGEEICGEWLRHVRACGFVDYNVKLPTGGGEIDVVARDGSTLVFVEVRSRGTAAFGMPEESIDRGKRMRVIRAARAYVAAVSPPGWSEARFDVVAVEGPDGARVIRHYPGAFDAQGKIL